MYVRTIKHKVIKNRNSSRCVIVCIMFFIVNSLFFIAEKYIWFLLSLSFSLTVIDTDVRHEARTLRTARPLILGFDVSLRSNNDLTCLY